MSETVATRRRNGPRSLRFPAGRRWPRATHTSSAGPFAFGHSMNTETYSMLTRYVAIVVACLIAIASIGGVAMADDKAPTADQRKEIEDVLRTMGYEKWGEIEKDGSRWEVDDAVHSNGRKYDLELDGRTLAILKQDIED